MSELFDNYKFLFCLLRNYAIVCKYLYIGSVHALPQFTYRKSVSI